MATPTQVLVRKTHRAGPVEKEGRRKVQRCLRCDLILNVVTNEPGKREIRVGRRVTIGDSISCPGILGDDA